MRNMFFGIQYLRAIAAIAVVLLHAKGVINTYLDTTNQDVFSLAKNGFHYLGLAGVDLFFVISGFIICLTFQNIDFARTEPIRDFIIRRIIRIVPLFWITLTFHILASKITSGVFNFSISNVIATYLFLPSLNINGYLSTAYPISWTLNYEMFFYFSLAILGIFFGKKSLLLVIVQFLLLSITFYVINDDLNFIQRFYFNPQSLEFTFGIIIALIIGKYTIKPIIASGLTLLSLALYIHLYQNGIGDGYIDRVINAGIPSALLVLAFTAVHLKPKTLFTRIFNYLGDASYSIYLIHMLCFSACRKLLVVLFPQLSGHSEVAILYMTISLLAILAGCVMHSYVEKPVLAFLSEKHKNFKLKQKKTITI